ncbi:MAG: DUF222 domain-containing protein [Microthrixaceae bacterium]
MFYRGTNSEPDESPDGSSDGTSKNSCNESGGLLSGLLGAVAELDDLPSSHLEGLSDERVSEAMLSVEKARRFLDGVAATVIVEAHKRDVTDRRFGLRTGPWLARDAQLPSGVAKSRVKTSTKIALRLPFVFQALVEGRIGFDHARVIANAANPRIVDQIAAISPALIDAIDGVSFEVWSRDVQAVADLLDLDGGHDPSGDVCRNRLSVKPVGDVTVIRGELVGEQALIATQALNTIADELFERFKRDNQITPEIEIPDRQTLLALALIEACRRGLAGTTGKAPRPEVALTLTPANLQGHGEHCADGCGGGLFDPFGLHNGDPSGLCNGDPSGLCNGDPSGGHNAAVGMQVGCDGAGWGVGHPTRDLVGAVASQLTSTMDTWAGMWVTDPNGTPLREDAFECLLCDPDVYTLIVNSLGVPLDMGHRVRFATRAQRRAMAARDGGCVFPGCGAKPEWCDAHHITEWHKRHSTDLDGLLFLCRHHHGVAHRKGWDVQLDPNGWSQWTTPKGDTLVGQRHGRTRPPP